MPINEYLIFRKDDTEYGWMKWEFKEVEIIKRFKNGVVVVSYEQFIGVAEDISTETSGFSIRKIGNRQREFLISYKKL